MKPTRARGFTLVEFVIAIVFVGVVLGPFLLYVARIHDLNSALGQQARREAWRSFTDQAVAAGIAPTAAAVSTAVNIAVPAIAPTPVTTDEVTAMAGLPTLVPLRTLGEASVAEPRPAGAGFQIGAGAPVAPRGVPQAPLQPIVMPTPIITPADGTIIAATSLAPAGVDEPYTATVTVSSIAGARVQAVFDQPSAIVQGLGAAVRPVNAVDLMNGVRGTAWTEFAGNADAGQRPVDLGDGRVRWLVTTPEQRLQIYEPSPRISFAYQIALGAPVLVRGSGDVNSGATVGFDFAAYSAVQRGAEHVRIDFPAATKRVFGAQWPTAAIGFQWTFHDEAGPFSGDVQPFFQPDRLSLWSDTVVVAATAVVPAAAVAPSATWTFARIKTSLGVPLLSTAADASGFFAAGQVQFTAPVGPDGVPLGRLSFENATSVSTGPTLSIAVIP